MMRQKSNFRKVPRRKRLSHPKKTRPSHLVSNTNSNNTSTPTPTQTPTVSPNKFLRTRIQRSTKLVSQKACQLAIASFFIDALGIPPKTEWFGKAGPIATIARTLNLSKGSSWVISNVLNDVTKCLELGIEYTGDKEKDNIERNTRKLKPGSIDEQLVANWMEDGLGFRRTTMLLNVHRKEQGLLEIGKNLCVMHSIAFVHSIPE